MLGYRFDRKAGTIEQGGLVQLNSIPAGATLTINAARLSATTPAKTTLSANQHSISMVQNGYTPWQKTVQVVSGNILWLNYARLIPIDRPVDTISSLTAITSSLSSPNRKWYAMTTEKSSPAIRLVDVSVEDPEIKTLALPELSFTKPVNVESASFHISAWDPSSSRYILLEHRFDDTNEWIVVDTEEIAKTKNISTTFDISMVKPQFSNADSTVLYAVIEGDIRRIDIDQSTISAPLVRNVAEFSFFDKSTLLYVTNIDEIKKTRSVGYRSEDASESRAIRTFSDEGTVPLHIAAGKYYNQTYLGIAYDSSIEILTGSLPRSDSKDTLALTAEATMSTPEAINFFSNKTDGRFFVAQHKNSYSVYDLELQKATTTTIRGDAVLEAELRWLDGHSVWSSLGGQLHFYEFDGANQNTIMPIVAGQNPALSPNNRYIYAPTVDEKGVFHLSRVRLILP